MLNKKMCFGLVSVVVLGLSCSKKNSSSAPAGSGGGVLGPAQVYLSEVAATANQAINLSWLLSKSVSVSMNGVQGKVSDDFEAGDLEISILGPDGVEEKFDRLGVNSSNLSFTPRSTGNYTVVVRDNSGEDRSIDLAAVTGGTASGGMESNDERVDAPHKDIMLKAVVVLARQCKEYSSDGNSTLTFNAPTGEYYVQPFVFLGQVGADKKVTALTSANINIVAGAKTFHLQSLPSLAVSLYREISGLTDSEHLAYTKSFYQGYFGGAGELYTMDTFWFKGNCSSAQTVALDANDPGATSMSLSIVDNSLSTPLNASYPIRASIYPSGFYTYEASGVKLQDYTQCTYNRLTGEPVTYNGAAGSCKTFSLSDLPYLKMEGTLPSADSGLSATELSDPTRIMFYGHSMQKDLWVNVGANSDALSSGAMTEIDLQGCLHNGGIHAVPLDTDKTFLPLSQMNTKVGDVISLSRRPGTYTGLTDFYQGDVDLSGSVSLPVCLPTSSSSCGSYKTITINTSACYVKADSGISVTSIADSFIYPSYFEMSGIIGE